MSDISHVLMIKFGLGRHPNQQQIQEWLRLLQSFITKGYGVETAGAEAAKLVFPDCGTHFYASQSDTIVAMLAKLRGK